jgi:hypothetical protein
MKRATGYASALVSDHKTLAEPVAHEFQEFPLDDKIADHTMSRQVLHEIQPDGGRRTRHRGRVIRRLVGFKFPRGPFQFAAKDSHVPRRFQRQRHAISRNPPDLKHDIITDMDPFTNFSTEH